MTEFVPVPIHTTPTDLLARELEDEARGYRNAARASNTRRAYASDWRAFTAWCDAHRLGALPAEPSAVVLYITDMARTAKPATIRRRLSSISVAHQCAGLPTPTTD